MSVPIPLILVAFVADWTRGLSANLSQVWNITDIQSMDGSANNKAHPDWGAAGSSYLRKTPWEYGPNQSPNGQTRPNPRQVSNVLFAQKPFLHNSDGISDFAPAWGVMLHLDITVALRNTSDPFHIPIPPNDPIFNAPGGESFIPVYRSNYLSVDEEQNLRVIPNGFTAWIDCSGLYGNSLQDMRQMRSFVSGKLKSVMMEMGEFPAIFDSGPQKGYFQFNIANLNMMPQLMINYLLFFREHNRRATVLASRHPDWSDELLFQRSRRWVISVIQKITADNYIPAITGQQLPSYSGYNPSVNPGIDLFFANVAFRYGHSTINQLITRIDEYGNQVPEGHLVFSTAFYDKLVVQVTKYGIESILRGFATQRDQAVDTHFVSEVRNYLPLNGHGHYFDLSAIGIQRSRELGLPSYSVLREFFNLTKPHYWSDITSDVEVQQTLSQLYASIDDLDAYVGSFAEDAQDAHSTVAPLQRVSILDQFTRLRDGDRFWYENPGVLSPFEMNEVSSFTLGDMVRLNTNCTYYPDDPFIATPLGSGFFLNGPGAVTVADNLVSQQVSLLGTLLLSWSIRASDGYIDFQFESNSSGWFGIGFGPSMMGADIYFVKNMGNGTFGVQDSWSFGQQAIPSDVSQGGSDDVINAQDITSKQSFSKRVVTWSRLLDTGDPFDVKIENREMQVIFAFSDGDALTWHGAQNRLAATLNFYSVSTEVITLNAGLTVSPGLKALHGASMYFAFGYIYPLGIFVARYHHDMGTWLSIHRSLMLIVTSNVLMAALTAIVGSYGDATFLHYQFGLAVVASVIGTAALGYLSVKFHEQIGKYGMWAEQVRFIHRVSGYVTYIGGLITGYFGVRDITTATKYAQSLPLAYAISVIIVPLTLIVYGELVVIPSTKSKSVGSTDISSLPYFTWDDINQRVSIGSKWLVIDKLIYDVDKYVYSHPGGSRRILQMIGLDATTEFSGSSAIRSAIALVPKVTEVNSRTMDSLAAKFGLQTGALTRRKHHGPLSHPKSTPNSTMTRKSGESDEKDNLKRTYPSLGEHRHSRFAKFILAGMAVGKLKLEEAEKSATVETSKNILRTSVLSGSPVSMKHFRFCDYPVQSQGLPILVERFTLLEFDMKISLNDPKSKQPVYLFRFSFRNPESELVVKMGDYVLLQFVDEGGRIVTRPYFPVRAINKGGIDIVVKIVYGEMTKYLLKGDSIRIRGPIPEVDLHNSYSETGTWKVLGIIAENIGLAGALHLIDHHLCNTKRDPVTNRPGFSIHLLVVFGSETDVFAYKDIKALEASCNGSLVVTTLLRVPPPPTRNYGGLTGEISAEILLATMPKPDTTPPWYPEVNPSQHPASEYAGSPLAPPSTSFRDDGKMIRNLSSRSVPQPLGQQQDMMPARLSVDKFYATSSMNNFGNYNNNNSNYNGKNNSESMMELHSMAMVVYGETRQSSMDIRDLLLELGYMKVFALNC